MINIKPDSSCAFSYQLKVSPWFSKLVSLFAPLSVSSSERRRLKSRRRSLTVARADWFVSGDAPVGPITERRVVSLPVYRRRGTRHERVYEWMDGRQNKKNTEL